MPRKPEIPVIGLPSGDMPAFGLGTWRLRGDECEHAVRKALELGYRHIDTAELYRNETQIADAIAASGPTRSELFLTSKVMPQNAHFDGVMAACNASLKRLQTDYLDLYLLHWPGRVPLDETFRAFRRLLEEKRVRNVGISNFNKDQLRHALQLAKDEGIAVAVNQVEFHPYLFQKELLQTCRKNGVHVTAYCPIARGIIMDDPVLTKIANRHQRSVAQVSLRWLLQHGLSTIPKASKEKHLEENLGTLHFTLTREDMAAIDSLGIHRRLVPL
ncbi:aldo/keto reductase [Candidatus Micrarchaeota archaeon]|nr:aldo/keto reductase [Candidatus Micrarchaeota archaeon]